MVATGERTLQRQHLIYVFPEQRGELLQLGAFKSQEAAESFMAQMRAKLGDAGKQLSMFIKDGLTRVHLGPYTNQNEARSSAEDLKGMLGFKPVLNLR